MAYIIKDRKPAEPWRVFRKKATRPWMLPFVLVDWICDQATSRLSGWALPELLEYAGAFSILVGVVLYFTEASQRREQRHFQAWQVINSAQGKSGNGGRIEALQDLNEDGVSLVAVDVSSDAYLYGLTLPGAQLRRANFQADDLRHADLHGASLQDANLNWANLRNANLQNVDFTGADMSDSDLTGADLRGAILTGVDLSNCDLTNANLTDVKDWQSIAAIKNADIHALGSCSPDFQKWAAANVSASATTQPTTR